MKFLIKKVKIISENKPSKILEKEIMNYLDNEESKEKYIFHKHRDYLGVYKEIIENKTYYIKVSRPKNLKRGLKKRLGIVVPRSIDYYKKSKILKKLGIKVVEPEYIILDKRNFFIRKNISIFRDFKEVHNLDEEFTLKKVLKTKIKNLENIDDLIYKYLKLLIILIKNNIFYTDCNLENFFYDGNSVYILDLDDMKIKRSFSLELYNKILKRIDIFMKEVNIEENKRIEYIKYFEEKIKKRG